ncbi:hypothetical protein HYFRA_00011616 [Hymenoscyphus fraxineus]|uniref:Uncharacterized protein n=1 Tax=Hymenoscyphus fraxineus TaxID=746836 RepID=A0A9N9KWQ0_9HELO|nr:hypothetical protein HYFRA_00011616 [Hymenoscyphus fraxineus]
MAKPTDKGTCPSGGLWYECTGITPSFQGCCVTNPCQQNGCPATDLRAAGIPTAGIVATNEPNVQCPSTSLWYTCTAISPSFQGCCKTNPCQQNGCPAGDLEAAQFKVIPGTTSTLQSTTASSTSTGTAAPVQPNVTSSDGNHNTAIIAGVVTGGVVLIALIICGFLILKHRRKKDKNAKRDSAASAAIGKDPESPGMRKLTPTDGIRGPENEGFYTATQGTPRPDHDKNFSPTRPAREGDAQTVGPPPYGSPQPSPNQPAHSPQISMMSGHPSPTGAHTWGGHPSPHHNNVHEMVDAGSTNIPQQLDSTEMPASARSREDAVELPGVTVSK